MRSEGEMSFKSIARELREMKDGMGSISKRRVEGKHWCNRTRSHIAPDVAPSEPVEQGKWANLPPELLLDIIQRVEESETTWPARTDVVFCASVCKSWRDITKEIVKTPEECGRLTFPISLKQYSRIISLQSIIPYMSSTLKEVTTQSPCERAMVSANQYLALRQVYCVTRYLKSLKVEVGCTKGDDAGLSNAHMIMAEIPNASEAVNVLGFFPIRRPNSFDFDGAWLFNYGIGIHLLQSEDPENMPKICHINPKDNHVSFQGGEISNMVKNEDSGSPRWSALLFMQTTEDVARAAAAAATTVRSPRPSVVFSSKDDNGNSPLHKLQHQVSRVLKGFSQPLEVKSGAYNPEVLTSQKRQWASVQLQSLLAYFEWKAYKKLCNLSSNLLITSNAFDSCDHRPLKEPSRLFESMVVVGLHPNCDIQALQKQYFGRKSEGSVLFVYPLEKQLPLKYKDLLSFCFPGGVEVHAIEKTSSMSELNEILLGGTTGISVGFSFLGRDFYNALANKDQEQFTKQLLYYLGAFAGGIPYFCVERDYARETLSLRWRSWMTNYYIDRYLKNRTFYKIQSQSIIDNPDQRIVDDLSSFTGTALSFSLTLFNAAVDLVSFSNILYGIYPPLFAVLVVYSISGTAISVFLGRVSGVYSKWWEMFHLEFQGLVTLNFLQEKKEADFRFGLVRLRENAESIAFYAGEDNEKQLLLQRFRSAFENLT
ncbi:unnamed protein product [Camellia sinensis]